MKNSRTTAALIASLALGSTSSWAQTKPGGAGLGTSPDITRCELYSWLAFSSAGKSKDQIVEAQCGAGPADTAKMNGFPTTNPDRPAWIAGCRLRSTARSSATTASSSWMHHDRCRHVRRRSMLSKGPVRALCICVFHPGAGPRSGSFHRQPSGSLSGSATDHPAARHTRRIRTALWSPS